MYARYILIAFRGDILCILGESFTSMSSSHLGSAVSVERVVGGTISFRRASLDADTIQILLLVKRRLHLARAKANAAPHR